MAERPHTTCARPALALADTAAARLERPYIGTEHPLIGLLAEKTGPAAQILNHLGVTTMTVRAGLQGAVGESVSSGRPHGQRGVEPSMYPISRPVAWGAVIALLVTALIHFLEAPDALTEATYKGVLFVANGAGALLAVVGILRGVRSWGWLLGLVVTGGAIVGYVASRTVGLPGIPAEPDAWLEPRGVAALLAEGAFVLLFVVATRASRRSMLPPPT